MEVYILFWFESLEVYIIFWREHDGLYFVFERENFGMFQRDNLEVDWTCILYYDFKVWKCILCFCEENLKLYIIYFGFEHLEAYTISESNTYKIISV